MLYRRFGRTDEHVSNLGFGCMRLPVVDGDSARIDEEQAGAMVRRAIEGGVNYLDTAYGYHGGESERFLGRLLKDGLRDQVFLATKLRSWVIERRDEFDRFLDEQLAKLQTDRIDMLMLHGLSAAHWPRLRELGAAEFFDAAVADGRIRYPGFSFHDKTEVLREIVDGYDWVFCMVQYNLLDVEKQAGTEGVLYAAERGLAVNVMEPLRGGQLANHVPPEVQAVWDGAPERRSPVEWALRFVWDHPEVNVVLSGMSTLEQVEENLRLADLGAPGNLTAGDRARVAEARAAYEGRIRIQCTDCGYCMPCPQGVNIPRNFSIYNNGWLFDNLAEAAGTYRNQLKPEERAAACIQCGECLEKCPQHLEIPDLLEQVEAAFAGA
jgi:predicted aldo/keto reductase-like oxidoreductase